MIDPITGFLISTAISFVFDSLSAKIENKQKRSMSEALEAYNRMSLEHGHKAAIEHLNILRDAKLKIIKDEWENMCVLRQNTHDTLVSSIAGISDLDMWPLSVPPLVINNLPLKYGLGGRCDIFIEPLHVIFTPSNSKRFNKQYHKKIEDNLSLFFQLNHNGGSSHPIIFYKGCWDESRLNFAPLTANINSKLKAIPVIIITPKIIKNNLKLCISYWNIHGWNNMTPGNIESFQVDIPFGRLDVINSDNDFVHYNDFETLTQSIGMIVSMLCDKYMWSTYKIAPQLLKMLHDIYLQDMDMDYIIPIYRNYISFLKTALECSSIHPILDMNVITKYLESTDAICGQKEGLSEVIKFCPKIRDDVDQPNCLSNILFFGEENMRPLVKYCSDYYWLYRYPVEELIAIQKMWVGCTLTDKIRSREKLTIEEFKKAHNKSYSDIIDFIKRGFELSLRSDYERGIHAIKMKAGVVNGIHSILYDDLSKMFKATFTSITPQVCKRVVNTIIGDKIRLLRSYYEESLRHFIVDCQFLPETLIYEAANDALYYLMQDIRNEEYPDSQFWIDEHFYFSSYSLVNAIVNSHINVPFIGKDQLLYDFSSELCEYIFNKYMYDTWENVINLTETYVKRCFGIVYMPPESSYYDDYSHKDYSNELPGYERVG